MNVANAKFCIEDPTQPILQWLPFGFCVWNNIDFIFCIGGNPNFNVYRYQHVGISNAKLWCWGSKPMPGPKANGFALQWSIRLKTTLTILHEEDHILSC